MSPINGSSKSPFKRIGLSEYTSQRLAELKARRAEADEEMKASPKSKGTETDHQLDKESNSEDSLSLNCSPTKQESKPDRCCHEEHDVRANEGRPVEVKVPADLPRDDESVVLSEGHSQLSSTIAASKVQKVTCISAEEVTTEVHDDDDDDNGDDDDDVCQRVVEDANETKEQISLPLLSQNNCSANNQIPSNSFANQMVSYF